ncbi:MAG: hypothetical protein ACP5SH_22785 [Syntrophobacteraceae bacterium]
MVNKRCPSFAAPGLEGEGKLKPVKDTEGGLAFEALSAACHLPPFCTDSSQKYSKDLPFPEAFHSLCQES